jgi:hypothetical protein
LLHNKQHLKIKNNNNISKLAIIILSIVLITGISFVPVLQTGVYAQRQPRPLQLLPQQQQQPAQQQQQQPTGVGLSQVIKQVAQQVATANPGTNSTHVYQILVQLAKQTAQTSTQAEAIEEIRQISSQVTTYPFGTLSQVLAHFARQVASGNSNVVQVVQQTIQEKASSGSSSNNITQSLANTAIQQASGGSRNVNLVIRNAAQILANRAGVPVEKVEAVIIQIALQFAQAQGKVVTGQYIFQLANQIIQDPNGVLAQAILQLVTQDDGGRTSQTTTIIKNVIKIKNKDDGKPHIKCDTGYHWDNKQNKCVPNYPPPCNTGYHWDYKLEKCVPIPKCDSGYHWDNKEKKCVPDDKPPCDPKTQTCPPPPDCKKDPNAEGCKSVEPAPLLELDDGTIPPDTDTDDTDNGDGGGDSGDGDDSGDSSDSGDSGDGGDDGGDTAKPT